MKSLILWRLIALSTAAQARADEDVSIRGNFPQLLARGETDVADGATVLRWPDQSRPADRAACGMKRVFEFAGADYVDMNDLSGVSNRPARRLAPRGTGQGVLDARARTMCFCFRAAPRRPLRLRRAGPLGRRAQASAGCDAIGVSRSQRRRHAATATNAPFSSKPSVTKRAGREAGTSFGRRPRATSCASSR